MASPYPSPENFPKNPTQKIEREQKEGAVEEAEQKETLEEVIDNGLDQADAAANILAVDVQGKMQAIANQGAAVKQSDQQLLLSIIGQGKTATNHLKSTLTQLLPQDDDQDDGQQNNVPPTQPQQA